MDTSEPLGLPREVTFTVRLFDPDDWDEPVQVTTCRTAGAVADLVRRWALLKKWATPRRSDDTIAISSASLVTVEVEHDG